MTNETMGDNATTRPELTTTRNEAFDELWKSGLIVLILLGVLNCLVGLGTGPALGDHESINALGARQSIRSGNWLIPHVGEVPWIRKMPLGIWLIGGASYLVDGANAAPPVSEYAARFPSAVAGLLNALVVCWLGSMMFGKRAGLVAGFISAGCAATVFGARNAQVDMVLTLMTTLTFACFWRGAMHEKPSKFFMVAYYVALAGAMLAKAPLPLAIVGMSLAIYWLAVLPVLARVNKPEPGSCPPAGGLTWAVVHQFKRLPVLWIIPGTLLFLVLAGAWPFYVYMHVGNALPLWRIEYLDRFSGDMAEKSQPFLYYIPLVFGLTAPFMLSIPEAMAATFLGRYREYRKGLAFALTWAIAGTLLLSLSSFKRPHYLLSVIPAYCLLLAPVIDRLFFGPAPLRPQWVRRTCAAIPVLLAAGFAIGGIVLHRQFPTLLNSYIITAVLCWAIWSWAGFAYARGQRTRAFLQLNLGVPILILIMWPAIGRHVQMNGQADALAAELLAHGVTRADEIVLVDGRPDSSIEYYSGLHIQRLINEIEMAGIGKGRGKRSMELYMAFVDRINERLAKNHPVYLILSAGSYHMLLANTNTQADVLFHLKGFEKDPEDEPIVITQKRFHSPRGQAAPNSQPATATAAGR